MKICLDFEDNKATPINLLKIIKNFFNLESGDELELTTIDDNIPIFLTKLLNEDQIISIKKCNDIKGKTFYSIRLKR